MSEITTFKVMPSEETRIETKPNEPLGWGAEFPCGMCMVDWNRTVFAPEDRLDHPHISQYGSLADVEQGTGGEVVLDE